MAVRRCKKADAKRIAIATGAAFLPSLSNMEGVYPGVLWMAECSNSMVCNGLLLLHFAHSVSWKMLLKKCCCFHKYLCIFTMTQKRSFWGQTGYFLQILRFWTLSIVLSLSKLSSCLSLSLEKWTSSNNWTRLSKFYLKTETECSLRNVFWKRNRMTF
jgi:hypothetical protein